MGFMSRKESQVVESGLGKGNRIEAKGMGWTTEFQE
jgi:hypothetical protein